MQKSEMMKRYEAETGEILDIDHLSADANGSWCGYIEELEGELRGLKALNKWSKEELTKYKTKAAAYDRLISGEPTAKEIANVLNRIVAMDADYKWYAFGAIPYGTTKFRWVAVRGSTKYRVPCFKLTFDGDWKDSLTFPDGWREK